MLELSKKICKKVVNNGFHNFHVFHSKNKSKFSIVFAHNILGNHKDMKFLIEKFIDKFNVIAIDFSGHAGSDNLTKYSYDAYLHDCVAALNYADTSHVIWIGQGIGGILGAKLAKLNSSPILGLVAFDVMKFTNKSIDILDIEFEYKTFIDAREAIYEKYSKINKNILDQIMLDKYKVMNEMFVNNYHIKIISQIDNFFNCNVLSYLEGVKCKTLVMDDQDLLKSLKNSYIDVYNVDNEIILMYQEEQINFIYNWANSIFNNAEVFMEQFQMKHVS
ncbi:alpha/beta fold hydrolase [Candidatus Cytomitobacter primus]|uniref:AB hydrolase-1 domain-containing protein n=1 Tax=Candidatus Cytomitobacter primus TaxID=2066024 RepID=A0A5C0UE22_9PROT|nr:alpha/beta fold hydrolase [Candidatus Cytomitobacter primus]QEK38335.1 hypothetical protein FZC34_00125 [Candidatus Cytomitobacter primus]